MYEYKARYIENHDGDTIKFEIDLGFGIFFHVIVRLAGINCPEINSKDADEKRLALMAKVYTEQFFFESKEIVLKTYKDQKEKYGRYLAEVKRIEGKDKKERILNQELIDQGLAKSYMSLLIKEEK